MLSPPIASVADITITTGSQNFRQITEPIIDVKGPWLQDRRCVNRRPMRVCRVWSGKNLQAFAHRYIPLAVIETEQLVCPEQDCCCDMDEIQSASSSDRTVLIGQFSGFFMQRFRLNSSARKNSVSNVSLYCLPSSSPN
jgi:hypothetical protein